MNWFVNKLGPNPPARNAATSRSTAPQQAQKAVTAQKSAPAPQAQRAAAPPPAPEPDKKKKKGWF